MSVFTKFYRLLYSQRQKSIEKYYKNAWEIQERVFNHLIEKGIYTQYGQKYSYNKIKKIEEFQRQVPLVHYEDLYTWIKKIRQEEKDVLWPGKVRWLARSSGTTNDKSKFIPITNDSLYKCHYRGAADVLVTYLKENPQSKLFSGKTFTLGGSHQIDSFGGNVRCGDLSAILLQNIPTWADFFRTPSRDIVLIADWEEKIEKMLPLVAKAKVTAFAGVPSWNMVFIQKLLQYTQKTNLLEVWPHLELFMHGGVNFEPYRKHYQNIIPSQNMHYLETYNASEGFFAIQESFNDPGLLLMLDYGIFYEFINLDDYLNGIFNAIPLAEVQPNINYALVISTNGGLWRYIIGDTVMFTSVNPYKIIITGRTKHYLNVFGEELMVHNTDKAIAEVSAKTNSIVYEYTVAPVFMNENSKGCHEWLIEFEVPPNNVEEFCSLLDNYLKKLNSDYEAKRYKDTTLTKPLIRILPQGTFHKWFVKNKKVGGQNKLPRLSNNRRYVDEIIKMLNE